MNTTINNALALYGASLDDNNYIVKGPKSLGVKAVVKGKRLRFESSNGVLIASGPITEKFVSSFVEKFWYWMPIKMNPGKSAIFKKANQLMKEGYERKQAFAAAYSELGEPKRKTVRKQAKKNPSTKRKTRATTMKAAESYVHRVSQVTKKKPSKRLVKRRTVNLRVPVGVFPNPVKKKIEHKYIVQISTANPSYARAVKWKSIGSFLTPALAKEYAKAYDRAHYGKYFIQVIS